MRLKSSLHFALLPSVLAAVSFNRTNTTDILTVFNDRLTFSLNTTLGAMTELHYDGVDLLGPVTGRIGMAYFDGYVIPAINASVWSPSNPNPQSSRHYYVGQSGNADFQVHYSTSGANVSWVGVVMSETYTATNQSFQQWWFLRDGESMIHTLTRLAFPDTDPLNSTVVNLGNVQEFRQVISPNTPIWTHLVTNERQYGHLPSKAAIGNQTTVQDATWYLAATPNEPYVEEQSDYFTKYEFGDSYGDHKAHGFYSETDELGLWWVFNNMEGYTGGPLRSDLVVDTNLYNYYCSNHRGAGTMNLTTGFDRIFGPSLILANGNGSLSSLLKDAEGLASPEYHADFYDEISGLVPGLIPSSGRGSVLVNVTLPEGASNGKAVLAQVGVDFQDSLDPTVFQYWANISKVGIASIPRVKAGKYRLTLYAEGIFGDWIDNSVTVSAMNETYIDVDWKEDSAGVELWRLGVPDKTAGEFRHGFQKDSTRSLHPEEYRSYWGAWDFTVDFPNSVNFTIGESDPAQDWNYVHWSRYGGSYTHPEYTVDNVNEWTVNFDLNSTEGYKDKTGTLTILLAAAHTPSGNLDLAEPTSPTSDLLYSVSLNGPSNNLSWTIPFASSSSCVERSGVGCYTLAHKFEFEGGWLKEGWNQLTLSLPFNASGGDVNFRGYSVNVMYDALRLEIG